MDILTIIYLVLMLSAIIIGKNGIFKTIFTFVGYSIAGAVVGAIVGMVMLHPFIGIKLGGVVASVAYILYLIKAIRQPKK